MTNYFSSLFNFGQISMLLPEIKLNQDFLKICAFTQYILNNYKVSQNYALQVWRSCANKIRSYGKPD